MLLGGLGGVGAMDLIYGIRARGMSSAIPIVSDFLFVTEDEVAVKREDDDLDSEPEPDF